MENLKSGEGYFSVNSGYMTKTETDRLLSIERYTLTVMASGAEKLRYDTIDKEKQILITLPGLFQDKSYVDIISNCIKSQMKEQMQADAGIIYWVDSREGFTDAFDKISETKISTLPKMGNWSFPSMSMKLHQGIWGSWSLPFQPK